MSGTDYAPGDVFNAGVDGICPLLPAGWPDAQKVSACEAVCDNATECLGFTYYQVLLLERLNQSLWLGRYNVMTVLCAAIIVYCSSLINTKGGSDTVL